MRWGRNHLRRVLGKAWLNSTLILGVCLGGLLIAITVAGIVGLVINHNTGRIVEHALDHDVNLEDEGDDLRAAILDVRHYHRDIYFVGPDAPQALFNLTSAWLELEEQIGDYAEITLDPDDTIVTAARMEEMATTYWSTFRPAVILYDSDRAAFDAASATSLATLAEMERAAQDIEQLGEQRSAESLGDVDRHISTARIVLVALLGGLILCGIGLALIAVRGVDHVRGLYETQQGISARLEHALKSNVNFMADASHELRTPLTVLRANAEAGQAFNTSPDQAGIFDDIVTESARMTKLIDDLLILARSDSSALLLLIEPVDAGEWLQDLTGRAATLAREHDATLTAAVSVTGEIAIDVERINQAVMILVDNAAKYSGPSARISIQASTWRDELTIEVADNGPGIPPDDVPRVFDRFFRGSARTLPDRGGTGLGLPIARGIVEAHGGTIAVQSRVGEGTRVRIHLPFAAAPAGDPAVSLTDRRSLVPIRGTIGRVAMEERKPEPGRSS